MSISEATSVHVEVQALIEKHVSVLLNLAPATSPSFNQWSNFYQSVLHEKGYGKGQYVCFDKVMEQVVSRWPINWLKKECLWPFNKQSSWLHSIIRKHRKSFSFLEHIVLLDAIYEGAWSMDSILKQVPSTEEIPNSTHIYMSPLDDSAVHINKSKWLNLVKRYGTKLARIKGGGAIYTWLYRYHNKWLLKTNSHYQRPIQYENNRVDWRARDWRIVRAMYRILYDSEADLDCPRRSALWFIHQLEHSATVEKKLAKLPLTAAFLERYAEDTTDYQIRRLTRTLSKYSPQTPPIWRLFRESGLSDERITAQAREFIECVL
ncbi:TnsD family Tn7-like transposition protein [Thalassotalea sp. 1_MG-2023]|uniref:TnsD family Tn7-like transposition protein n=1 Tax=Thalassotalea sp. 1_MG-2023 TaxID=3062680 RepID=UPI0026E20D10|nr:TnsD family Tn7-like transposition protein [Thalassotalea sp. 1_MG-2023]MDO6427671.1 TnsD family Tn7-like transposition protein [Thalassotalea sp. 1_MG-2023]